MMAESVTFESSAAAQAEKMANQFLGFRFEIRGTALLANPKASDVIMLKLQEVADLLLCFGWTQKTYTGKIVGEVRCREKVGIHFQNLILNELESTILSNSDSRHKEEGSRTQGENVEMKPIQVSSKLESSIYVYEDTKIKLHFSHFKILDMDRITCFRDEPHKCNDDMMHVVKLW
jgi:hypothetical protein